MYYQFSIDKFKIMLLGESTLQWLLWGCHIVLLFRDVYVECILPQTFERFSQYFCILC
jgi:hypothetical protein